MSVDEPLAENRRRHVYDLLDELKVMYGLNPELSEDGTPWGMMRVERELGVDVVVCLLSHDAGHSTEAYLVALHELGHLMLLRTSSGEWDANATDNVTDADREAMAWGWALGNAKYPHGHELDQQDYRDILSHLNTYRSRRWEAMESRLRALAAQCNPVL